MPQHRGNEHSITKKQNTVISLSLCQHWESKKIWLERMCRLPPLTAWWCAGVWTVWDSGSLVWSSRRHRGCGSSACLGSWQRLYGPSTDARQLETKRIRDMKQMQHTDRKPTQSGTWLRGREKWVMVLFRCRSHSRLQHNSIFQLLAHCGSYLLALFRVLELTACLRLWSHVVTVAANPPTHSLSYCYKGWMNCFKSHRGSKDVYEHILIQFLFICWDE